MENKKQSSVDYLISQLQKSKDWYRVLNEVSQMSSATIDIIQQAKAMHKEEVINAANNGCKGICYLDSSIEGQQYYNETFGE